MLGAESLTALRPIHSVTALVFGLLALAASVFHLGRPQYAYRAVLGLRHSWLSREIVAFGAFAGAAILYAGSTRFCGRVRRLHPHWPGVVSATGRGRRVLLGDDLRRHAARVLEPAAHAA